VTEAVTVIGAGHGGCAAAGDLGIAGFAVTLYNRSPERLAPLERLGGIRFLDPEDHGVVPIARLTTDIGEALAASRRIVLMVPTTGVEFYARAMAPHLTAEHDTLVAPGHTAGALIFKRTVLDERGDFPCRLAEVNTLPYICRMTGDGEVTLWKRSERLLFAALPATETAALREVFAPLFPSLVPASSVLETSLSNLNAIMHPGAMLLNAGRIEATGGDFNFYSEGTTPAVGRVIKATDDDRLAIARAFGLDLPSFLEVFHEEGYTTDEAFAANDVYLAIRDSPPNRLIRSPSSLDHRYVREDIGYGLVPMSAFAAVAGVPVPTIDALVALADTATGFDMAQTGLSAENLGIAGMSADELQRYALSG
jgi:opine dehydrogenase